MPSCSVRVVCRFRPVNKREQEEAASGKLEDTGFKLVFEDECNVMVSNGKQTYNFSFDRIFDTNAEQADVYESTARPTVEDVLQGYNGTIFAYGQTGAGKTFTMFGPDGGLTVDNRGIIPRTSAHIFDYIDGDTSTREYAIKCSFLEIYKEVVRDLLNPKNVDMKIRESPQKGVWVDGLTEEFVTSEQDIADLITIGDNAKAVSATQMNSRSSRSHSLFMIIIEQKAEDGSTKVGKLNLVDLAGSEKVGKTGATGNLLEEAKKINQSLSALGNCIHALTESKRGHIPYRDSTLTRILQESLGGNTKTTLMIACSPHQFNVEETIGTLMFGKRAKTIKNTVKVNAQKSAAELAALIDTLKKELLSLQHYNTTLEKQIEYMKSAEYDPTKPLPKEFLSATPQPKAVTTVKTETRSRGPSVSATSPRSSPARGPSPLMTRLDEAPTSLETAMQELKNMREAPNSEATNLKKEVATLNAAEDEVTKELENSKVEMKRISEETESVLKTIDEERKQHASDLKKLEKEKNEKRKELSELTNQVQETTTQIKEMESALAQAEESILLFFTDNEMATVEKQKLVKDLQNNSLVLEQAKLNYLVAEKEANTIAQEFEQAKQKGFELEAKKKQLATDIARKQNEMQNGEIEDIKNKAAIELEQKSTAPLQAELAEAKATHDKLAAQVAELEAKVKVAETKVTAKKTAIRDQMVPAILRGYVMCTKLKEKGTPYAEQDKYTKLVQEYSISEQELQNALKTYTEGKLVDDLKKAVSTQKDEMEKEIKERIDTVQASLKELHEKTTQATEQHKALLQKLDEINKENEALTKEAESLKSKNKSSEPVEASEKSSVADESGESRSKSLSNELETVAADCEKMKIDIEHSRKNADALKVSTSAYRATHNDLTAKSTSEEDTIKRLTTILTKESKRVGSETITAALQQKRIDEQMRRITDFEEELARINEGIESMKSKIAECETANAELEQHIKEEDQLLLQAQAEIAEQKRLRLEQSKRNRKVFKPVQKKGIWHALAQKIDLSAQKQQLRSIASPFLLAAAQEHERSLNVRGDKK